MGIADGAKLLMAFCKPLPMGATLSMTIQLSVQITDLGDYGCEKVHRLKLFHTHNESMLAEVCTEETMFLSRSLKLFLALNSIIRWMEFVLPQCMNGNNQETESFR